jgi:hypothetical protein
MDNGQLLSHVDTDLVTRQQLAVIPAPEPTRTWRPIPHIELIDTLESVLRANQMSIREEKFALRRDGSTLFGVLQLAYEDTPDGQAAMGIRTSNDKSMSIQICAGLSVFVCDNLLFRGDLIALNRKHTSALNLRTELSGAVLRFQEHFGRLTCEIEHLKERALEDTAAKVMMHDVFAGGLLPLRFLPEVSRSYFNPQIPDFIPRTAWSLHNAFTASAKAMPMTTRLPAIQALGKLFGMSAEGVPARLLPAA